MADQCYYRSNECGGELWTCKSCNEDFCDTHFHCTSLGTNVECRACEIKRQELEEETRTGDFEFVDDEENEVD